MGYIYIRIYLSQVQSHIHILPCILPEDIYICICVCVCVYIYTHYIYMYIYIEDMATHSSVLAWRIPWTEKPGGLQSMGSQRVRHD